MKAFMVIGAIGMIGMVIWGAVLVIQFLFFPTDSFTSYQNGQVVHCAKPYGAAHYTCTYKDLDERGDTFQNPN